VTQPDRITDRTIISGLIKRIKEQRALLTVSLPNTKQTFNSAILDIDEALAYLILDELTPQRGHEKLMEQGMLNARAVVQGIETRFSTSLEQAETESGIWMYRVQFPAEVLYLQRRSSFRIPVGASSGVRAQLTKADQEPFEARVVDLSETGLGVELQAYTQLQRGDLLACSLFLPDRKPISCKFEVRYTQILSQPERHRVGGRLVELASVHRKTIARTVTDLQRDLIRKLGRNTT
jgi:c-di-GMP-binding flagellar brake protein YcgR